MLRWSSRICSLMSCGYDNNDVGAPAREAALKRRDEHAATSRGAEIPDFGMSLFRVAL